MSELDGLGPSTKRAYIFIRDHIYQHGIAPSLDEIAAHLGSRHSTFAAEMVDRMIKAGLVTREWQKKRAIRLTKDDPIRKIERLRSYARAMRHELNVITQGGHADEILRAREIRFRIERELREGDL